MNEEQIRELIIKYSEGRCSKAEKTVIENWYVNSGYLRDAPSSEKIEAEHKRILGAIDLGNNKRILRIYIKRIAIAASIAIITAAAGLYFYQKKQVTPTQLAAKNDIAPGGNKAFLTLSDGKRIILTDVRDGMLAEQSGAKITKAADGQLIYTVSNLPREKNKTNVYNTIETPRGGTYQVRLPDGTKVWLNAASTLRFPSSFARLVNRRVELLSGEAYFEVAKDKEHPFIVKSSEQEVEVLGTHFNVNNYKDEISTRTTLLEGSVRISSLEKDGTKGKSKLLKPNQQSVIIGKSLEVINSDIEEAVAWKSGYFKFQNEGIESVMKKIARWYNVKVQYAGIIPTEGLGGTMSREQNLSKVLDVLQSTGLVKFKINGDVVIVSK